MQSSRSVSLVLLLLWKQPDLKAAQSVVTGTEHHGASVHITAKGSRLEIAATRVWVWGKLVV